MQQAQVPALTLADLDEQEEQIKQRRDRYVEEANRNIAAFTGAIEQVRAQRAFLLGKQEAQKQVKNKGKARRRGKPAPKAKETEVVPDSGTAPEALGE